MIKVCGMTDGANIREVEALGVDLMGFIFYDPSPRCCRCMPDYLPSCRRVGVFVNAPQEYIQRKAAEYSLDWVQLHGQESPQMCAALRESGLKVIKAISVSCRADMELADSYQDIADMLLFDTKTPGAGGSGRRFDWSLLDAYRGSCPFLLSGGIGPDTASELRAFSHPTLAGYDLNSRFETSAGIKDAALLGSFIDNLK